MYQVVLNCIIVALICLMEGCGLLDLDFMAGFDWLDMSGIYLVLEKKGVVKL